MDFRGLLPSRPGGPVDPDRWVDSGPPRFPVAGKIVLAAVVPLLMFAWVRQESVAGGRAIALVAVAVAVGAALGMMPKWPVPALAIALAGAIAVMMIDQVSPVTMFAAEVALFGVAALRAHRVALIAGIVTVVVVFSLSWAAARGPVTDARVIVGIVATGLAFASGRAVRAHRALVGALADRARRANETREQEARARVAEERVRIARELHDVVAHQIAVINLHAGLARTAQGRDAEVADSSLGHVQEAARTVLEDLGTVLKVLRSGGDDQGLSPTSGLDRLDALLTTLTATGFEVHLRRVGRPRPMDSACDLAAFRIIQEALTNASKHGWGQTDLALIHDSTSLTIEVRNPARLDRPAFAGREWDQPVGTGQGLIGMHERAKAVGGRLSTGLDDDGVYRVDAVIPHHPFWASRSAPATSEGAS
jgi:signal transduction histidine kinase